ncbi:hypothetical protein D3C80_1990070 [compost metagenome]
MCNQAALICALIDASLDEAGEKKDVQSPKAQLETLYLNIHAIRELFLKEIQIPADKNRPPPDVSALPAWREEYDKQELELRKS